MSKRKYDVVARVGKYTAEDGTEKTRFQRVGAVLEGDRGPYLLIERWFNPVGASEDGKPCFLGLYPPGERDQQPEGGGGGMPTTDVTESDVPF